jgi:threonine dehydrogenase-like Zn-dependent dehydrogenase
MGAQVLALDVRAERLGVATRVGAASTLHLTVDDPASQVASDIERTWQPTLIFEAAGAARATELALHAVCPGGRVVLVGLAEQAVPLEPLWFVRRGLQVLGSLIYDHPADFLRSIDLLRTRRLDPAPLIGQVQLLADIAAVLDRRSSGPAGKVLVDVCGAR